MPTRNAIVIAVDGLRVSALGAYGNTWHPTSALDALASQSQVFDWMWSDQPTLEGFYKAVWGEGEHPLVDQLAAVNVETALTTDDRWLAEKGEAAGFSEVRCLEIRSQQSAAAMADTELAQLFAVAIDQLQTWQQRLENPAASLPSRLLWLHARGFHGAWDAPLELRESLLDEDDPPAPTFVTPPANIATQDHDELLLNRAAYAAQVMVLDECIGAVQAALAETGLEGETLLILVGCRGYALGEHGAVGGDVRSLYGELLHVPLVVRLPGAEYPPPRCSQLVVPSDLGRMLAEWFVSSEPALPAPPSRQFVITVGDDGERVLRTPAWTLRQPPLSPNTSVGASAQSVELYAKPDDRWEANEVADRLPDIAARLLAIVDRWAPADGGAAPLALEPLDDDLVSPTH